MLVTCKKCGNKFQTSQCGMVNCPECGNEQFVVNYDKPNNTALSANAKYVYHSASYDDSTANSAIKVLLAFSIVLLVLTALRFIASWTSFDNLSELKDEIDYIDEWLKGRSYLDAVEQFLLVYKSAMKKFLSLAYAEVFMHTIMCACAVCVLVYTVKAKECIFPITAEKSYVFEYYRKTFVWSIVMMVLSCVYAIIEGRIISWGKNIDSMIEDLQQISMNNIGDIEVMPKGSVIGVWIGVAAIIISNIICLITSYKLSRSEKQQLK